MNGSAGIAASASEMPSAVLRSRSIRAFWGRPLSWSGTTGARCTVAGSSISAAPTAGSGAGAAAGGSANAELGGPAKWAGIPSGQAIGHPGISIPA